jgi:MFS transporter, FHS family, L-fucose permease
MAIVGGALMPALQGAIIDLEQIAGKPDVILSFVWPLIFAVIANIAYRSQFSPKGSNLCI